MKQIFLRFIYTVLALTSQVSLANDRVVRISEIEVEPKMLADYLKILKIEAAASVKREPGVIAIFPMTQKDSPTSVRILEIYASKKAYESHLQTPHFKEYKTSTLSMVKSLKLIDMNELDSDTISQIFLKEKPY